MSPSVYVACPATRDFSVQYNASFFSTRWPGKTTWCPVIGQAIDVGRNTICKRFAQSDYDYLLMHDSDATWHPEAVERLVSRGLPFVTSVIFWRHLPTVPTIGKHVSLDATGSHMYSFAGTIERIQQKIAQETERGNVDEYAPNELVFPAQPDDLEEIDGCGMHWCLIRRDVIARIGYPWFECTDTNSGEDFDFCRKVQKAGFKLHVDYSVFTGHVVGPGMEIGVREFLLGRTGAPQVDVLWKV